MTRRTPITVLAALGAACAFAAPAGAATFVATPFGDLADFAPGDGNCDVDVNTTVQACTLRAAIQEANALAGADTVILTAGIYTLSLTGQNEQNGATGDLDVASDLTITGQGADATTVDAAGIDRVFEVHSGTVSISGVTVTGGGGVTHSGGIDNATTLTLSDVAVRLNAVTQFAGGILNTGTLTISDSEITDNTVTGAAGVGTAGGGLVNSAGTAALTNVTISGNHVTSPTTGLGQGGGITRFGGSVSLENVTVANNTATGSGGGLQGSGITASDSIVADNTAPSAPNCLNPTTSQGGNVTDPGSAANCGFTLATDVEQDPELGPLANHGGETRSHSLSATSPALDAAAGCPPPAADQRGVSRPQGPACDSGAYELEVAPPSGGGGGGGGGGTDDASNGGAGAGAGDTQTGEPSTPPPSDLTSPTFTTDPVFVPARFAPARDSMSLRASRVRRGSTLRFALSEPGELRIDIARRVRRRGVTRYVPRAVLRRRGVAGANAIRFSGRINGRALVPALYRATVTAVDAAGNRSQAERAYFRIVRR